MVDRVIPEGKFGIGGLIRPPHGSANTLLLVQAAPVTWIKIGLTKGLQFAKCKKFSRNSRASFVLLFLLHLLVFLDNLIKVSPISIIIKILVLI